MADDDAATIRAVLDGDIDRFAALVDKYQGQAIRLAFSLLGNYADAQDASQDAFVSAYRALGRFRGGAAFSTWLYRIVINECRDLWRRRARRPVMALEAGSRPDEDGASGLFQVDAPASGADPGQALQQRELALVLSSAIAALPDRQRAAFALHHLHGCTLEETAAAMGCRLGTAKAHLFRATERLQRHLAPWVAHGGG